MGADDFPVRPTTFESNAEAPVRPDRKNTNGRPGTVSCDEFQPFGFLQAPCRLAEGLPAALFGTVNQQQFDPPPTAHPAGLEPRRKDLGVVDDEGVRGAEQIGEIGEFKVLVRAVVATQMQKTRAIASFRRMFGYLARREGKVEIGQIHLIRKSQPSGLEEAATG